MSEPYLCTHAEYLSYLVYSRFDPELPRTLEDVMDSFSSFMQEQIHLHCSFREFLLELIEFDMLVPHMEGGYILSDDGSEMLQYLYGRCVPFLALASQYCAHSTRAQLSS